VERLEQFKQRQREEQEEVAKIKARGRSVVSSGIALYLKNFFLRD
jgi:hypothetical protein